MRSWNIFRYVSVICAPGLYCNFANFTCVTGFASSNSACKVSNTSSCTNPQEYCECNGDNNGVCTGPQVLTQENANDINALASCFYDSNCSLANPNCCNSKQCVVYDMIFSKSTSPSCGYGNPCTACSSKGLTRNTLIALIAGCILGVIIIAVLAVVFMRRKKHHYRNI